MRTDSNIGIGVNDMRKTAAVIVSMLLAACMLASCGTAQSSSDNELYKGKTVFGEVSKVSSDSITIKVGTGMGMPGSDNEGGDSEASSEAVLSVDKDTEITKSSFGGFGKGDWPDGEKPEKPEGGWPDGEKPEKPEGGWPDGEKPEKPEGGWPDGEKPEDGEKAEKPEDGKKPENMPDLKGEAIKLSDISEGDIVTITLDENGKTVSISVMGSDGEQFPQGETPEMPDKAGNESSSV